jgi:hypothetical protein
MMADEYQKVLNALAAASSVLQSNRGELNSADMRIRSLVNIAAREAKRAMLEIGADARAYDRWLGAYADNIGPTGPVGENT